MLDTKGPEIRLGTFASGQVTLEEGDSFTFTTYPVIGDGLGPRYLTHSFPKMFWRPNHSLGRWYISMEVQEVTDTEVHCRVLNAGILQDRRN